MYQVIQTKGEYEPWWFFDDWRTLIVKEHEFAHFSEASIYYRRLFDKLNADYPYKRTKKPYVTAFWSEEEMFFCENCADDIQIFHGIILLKDEETIQID